MRKVTAQLAHIKYLAGYFSLVVMSLSASGCATMLANTGASGWKEIEQPRTQSEIRERFGSPLSSSVTSLGRKIDVFEIRQRLQTDLSEYVKQGTVWCLVMGPACPAWLVVISGVETVRLPYVAVQSEKNKLTVGFVYAEDDHRVLYVYDVTSDPAMKFRQALQPINHPLSAQAEPQECRNTNECLRSYLDEAHRRAQEVGYELTAENLETFRSQQQMATEVDSGWVSRAEAEGWRIRGSVVTDSAKQSHSAIEGLTASLMKRIEEGACEPLIACVSSYITEVLRSGEAANYTFTDGDKDTFLAEIEIATESDRGELSRRKALTLLFEVTRRHLARIYYGL